MESFQGTLRMPGEEGPGLGVTVDLTGDEIGVRTAGADIGRWARGDVRINAMDDGFHLRAEGEEVILEIPDDAPFAIACGLTVAPPLLRRKMSAILRGE